jgi:hypothetical protein
MNGNGSKSKSGVFIYDSFRDNLIIDRYDPILAALRTKKIEHLRSENSEDAVTWNVFRTLAQINPDRWFPDLFKKAFPHHNKTLHKTNPVTIKLWESVLPPAAIVLPEGRSEIDIIIESDSFVWFIEAKYKSDISTRTTHDNTRDQIIRNMDVGLGYANGRHFFFSLLILNEAYSPVGVQTLSEHQESTANLSLLKWSLISALLRHLSENAENEYERGYATNAYQWLKSKGIV